MMDEKNTNVAETWLNEALQSEPGFTLPDNFANKVAETVSQKFAWETYLKEFVIYLLAILGILGISAGMIFIWFQANIEAWTNFLLSNLSWAIGINIIIVFVLFADKVLLRYFLFRSEKKLTN